METQKEREIYPNSKLSSVSFEMRYYPLLQIDIDIVKFQTEVRELLPDYNIEKAFKTTKRGGIQEQNIHTFTSQTHFVSRQ